MNYSASLSDFFKSPKWANNLLLGGVCFLIPIVGPIALVGWHAGSLFGRRDNNDFTHYPEFEFGKFGTYLERGVWPFLVQFVLSIVLIPIMWVLMAVPMVSMMALLSEHQGHGKSADPHPALFFGGFGLMAVAFIGFMVVLTIILRPIQIRAAMTQDFGQAFNLSFLRSFISKTWLEQIVAMFFLFAAALLLMVAGMMIVCVGMYFTMSVIMFVQWHLDRQLYDLYLARGGEPVPVSPKLSDSPPALPVPPPTPGS